MSFFSRETSISAGRPITLYEFQRDILRWRYTSADRNQVFQTQTFEAIAISDDGRRRTGEASADALKVIVPYNNPVARMYRGAPPADEIFLIIRELHKDEPEFRVSWTGSVQGVRFPSPERAEIICQSTNASMERAGLWLGYERGCPYSVYDLNCGVDPQNFAVEAIIQSIDGATISSGTFDAQEDGYFAGGYVEWPIGSGAFERRGIEQHVGSVLTLLGGTDGLVNGQGVTAYPGCPRIIEVCDKRFDNKDRFGGHPHMPGKSPYDGDPIFW